MASGGVLNFNAFSNDPGNQDVYLHSTLEQIRELANKDVEMQAPVSEYTNYLVVDTNVLLHYLEVLQQFVEDIERLGFPTVVIIPGVVIVELDRQKKRDGLGFFARRGSSWLLEKVGQRRSVKGQAYGETLKSTRNWKISEPGEKEVGSEMYNDNLILDCCLFFASSGNQSRQTFLCSADNNLCLQSESQGIHAIVPGHRWSSRDIAVGLYGNYGVDLSEFCRYKESYRNALDTAENRSSMPLEDDDTMMVDAVDEDSEWRPEHPLNLLHEAVIDHFTRLLVELVGRKGGPEVRQNPSPEEEANISRHAPRWRHFSRMSAGECLEYLNGRKGIKPRNPPAERFLLLKTRSHVPYARRGWEWARRDWEVALGNLKETAVAWDDISIPESLIYLQPHMDAAFAVSK
ncbi:PIN domain-containing protein [Crepidotus variabilis]|uniref:PIN domain-containing protein n=1 Tax=Crepidotus variabilis TaxID=179855 RepID=A0A9P6JVT5_9AGAR|nr:PIN domain-containing protein [Crepidotus variabilis]